MCGAFKQSQFLLKLKIKNKGNGKNLAFLVSCSSGHFFLQCSNAQGICEVETKLISLSDTCTLAAAVPITPFGQREQGYCVRSLAVLQQATTAHLIFTPSRNWVRKDGGIGNE